MYLTTRAGYRWSPLSKLSNNVSVQLYGQNKKNATPGSTPWFNCSTGSVLRPAKFRQSTIFAGLQAFTSPKSMWNSHQIGGSGQTSRHKRPDHYGSRRRGFRVLSTSRWVCMLHHDESQHRGNVRSSWGLDQCRVPDVEPNQVPPAPPAARICGGCAMCLLAWHVSLWTHAFISTEQAANTPTHPSPAHLSVPLATSRVAQPHMSRRVPVHKCCRACHVVGSAGCLALHNTAEGDGKRREQRVSGVGL